MQEHDLFVTGTLFFSRRSAISRARKPLSGNGHKQLEQQTISSKKEKRDRKDGAPTPNSHPDAIRKPGPASKSVSLKGFNVQGRGEVELGEVPWRWSGRRYSFPSLAPPRDQEEARGRRTWKPVTSRSALFEPVPKGENFTIHVEI